MRERWLGATGRRVPEIAVEGELDLDDALLLDDVSDVQLLRQAHEEGRPIAVRARTPGEVIAALSRPEVSVALVPPQARELLDLDLVELTYG